MRIVIELSFLTERTFSLHLKKFFLKCLRCFWLCCNTPNADGRDTVFLQNRCLKWEERCLQQFPSWVLKQSTLCRMWLMDSSTLEWQWFKLNFNVHICTRLPTLPRVKAIWLCIYMYYTHMDTHTHTHTRTVSPAIPK